MHAGVWVLAAQTNRSEQGGNGGASQEEQRDESIGLKKKPLLIFQAAGSPALKGTFPQENIKTNPQSCPLQELLVCLVGEK